MRLDVNAGIGSTQAAGGVPDVVHNSTQALPRPGDNGGESPWWTQMADKTKDWQVRLGAQEWQRFTYPRPEGDPLQLLGSVRRGARIGALAITPDGQYLQVNGDHLSTLNGSQIRRALSKAEPARAKPSAPASPQNAPVVVIKRRRTIVKQTHDG